jgi:hypothetical protein
MRRAERGEIRTISDLWDFLELRRVFGTRLTVNSWRMHAVYVPPRTNDGSALAHHVVLIWTAGGHTYGVGFHNVDGISQTLQLDLALARWIRLLAP